MQVQKDLKEYSPVEGVIFRLHCSIAHGNLHEINVGAKGRWECLIAGNPLLDIRDVEDTIKSGKQNK